MQWLPMVGKNVVAFSQIFPRVGKKDQKVSKVWNLRRPKGDAGREICKHETQIF